MKRFVFLLVFFASTCFSLFGQKEIITRATDLIVAKQYKSAYRYLDSLLKKQPRNVDALMMKGNVLLNQTFDTLPEAPFITEEDESPFTTELKPKPKILPERIVREIEKFWRKCLLLDSTRADIRKGLCSVYAMALMKKDLKEEIPRLMKSEADDGEQAFRLCEYARKFIERNHFAEGMELYEYIARLYPAVAGVRADIASEYFYAGKMKESLRWLDSCYAFKTIDETSFLNGAFLYSQLGYFYNAQDVLNAYSHQYDRRMGEFYYGLRLFADTSAKYAEVLRGFLQTADSNAYLTETTLARKLLLHKDSFSIADYRSVVSDEEIPDYYKVLLYTRGIRQFPQECEPDLYYGVYLASIKNYSSAIQFLENSESCEQPFLPKDMLQLINAYAMYKTDQQSLPAFRHLFNSENTFCRQAAKYFAATALIEKKQTVEANALYREILQEETKTKYSELVRLRGGVK